MKSIALKAYLFLMLSLPAVALAGKPGPLAEVFSSVRYENGALVVVNKPDGVEFTGRVGEASHEMKLAPGESAELPEGQLSFFYVGETGVSFVPLRSGRGFLVRKMYDDRKTGGGLRAVEFELVVAADGSLKFGQPKPVKENGPQAY